MVRSDWNLETVVGRRFKGRAVGAITDSPWRGPSRTGSNHRAGPVALNNRGSFNPRTKSPLLIVFVSVKRDEDSSIWIFHVNDGLSKIHYYGFSHCILVSRRKQHRSVTRGHGQDCKEAVKVVECVRWEDEVK